MRSSGRESRIRAAPPVQGYRIQLAAVRPYPVLDVVTERSTYRVTAVVSAVTEADLEHGLAGLNDTLWRLQAFGPIGSEVPALASTEITVLLDVSDAGVGTVSGSGGCNGFTGAGLMEQEDRFFTELPNVIGCHDDGEEIVSAERR